MRDGKRMDEREILLAGLKDFAPPVPEAETRSDARSQPCRKCRARYPLHARARL